MAIFTGCRAGVYRASRLPNAYRTSSIENHSKLNLSRFASAGTNDSLIAPGDLLEVTITSGRDGESLLPTLARVSDEGMVLLNAIGSVPVAGLETFEASQNIVVAGTERGIYRAPKVTVQIKEKAVTHVTVLGEVKEPGVHAIPRGSCDLIRALGAAGGLTEEAGTSVEIIKNSSSALAQKDSGQEIPFTEEDALVLAGGEVPKNEPADESQLVAYENLDSGHALDLADPSNRSQGTGSDGEEINLLSQRIDLAEVGPKSQPNYHLNDRDVIMVHPREKRLLHVSGLVKEPGQFDLPSDQDVRLLDAIALAGGLSSVVANKVLVIRHIEGKSRPVVIQASLHKAKRHGLENIRLAPGDTVSVEQTPATLVLDTISSVFRVSMGISNTALSF